MMIIYQLTIIVVRIVFVLFSYLIFENANWHKIFSYSNENYAKWACIVISIAVGFLVSSFFIEIIEILRMIFFNFYTE